MPGREAGLADQRRLLVAGHAGDRHRGARTARPSVAAELARRCRAPRAAARAGRRRASSSSSSQSWRWMSNSSVRDALVTSVACTAPPVSRHSRKLSIVPKASSPRSARARARPARCRAARRSWWPRNRGRGPGRCAALHRLAVALPAASSRAELGGAAVLPDDGVVRPALPVARSHSTVVSRWLVMPIAGDVGAELARRRARCAAGRDDVAPDLLRVVLDPAGLRIMLRQLAAAPGRAAGPRRRTRWRACWWCPGRWRGCRWRETRSCDAPRIRRRSGRGAPRSGRATGGATA